MATGPASAGDTPLSAAAKIQRVFDELHTRYPERVDDEALTNRAIVAMLQALDPYSTLLDRNAYLAFQQDARGVYVGLGVEVEYDRDSLTVRNSAVDSPGFEAGLRDGDRITMLDGVSLAGLTLDQALHLARGDIDSHLKLTVVHAGDAEARTVTVRRSQIPVPTVRERRLGPAVGYVRIERFRQSTPQLVMGALRRLADPGEPPLSGLVLDLRDNPGGSVRAAVGVAGAFLPAETLVVSMEGPCIGPDSKLFTMPREARLPPGAAVQDIMAYARSLPMVVLIDSGSASAAEILAGALQDHRRAVLLGTTSYGKGSVQSIVPLGDGTALKLTVARYLTPGGRAIHGKGIEPDLKIEAGAHDGDRDGPADRQLEEARRILGGMVAAHAASVAPNSAAAEALPAVTPISVSLPVNPSAAPR